MTDRLDRAIKKACHKTAIFDRETSRYERKNLRRWLRVAVLDLLEPDPPEHDVEVVEMGPAFGWGAGALNYQIRERIGALTPDEIADARWAEEGEP